MVCTLIIIIIITIKSHRAVGAYDLNFAVSFEYFMVSFLWSIRV